MSYADATPDFSPASFIYTTDTFEGFVTAASVSYGTFSVKFPFEPAELSGNNSVVPDISFTSITFAPDIIILFTVSLLLAS